MRKLSFAVASLLTVSALVLAGCQSGDGVDALDVGNGRSEEPVKLSELRMYCPAVQLRQGTAYFNTYDGSGEEPSDIIYQASIADVTRTCSKSGDMLNINIAIAGRIVPGPKGRTGTITMPIRVAMIQDGQVAYSELFKYPVNVDDTIGATQFIFDQTSISIPNPSQQNVRIFAGYDEGPYDTP